MSADRRRAAEERRQAERVPAVFAVKKAIGKNVQLCQAEDITPSGMTMAAKHKRLRFWQLGSSLVGQ